MKYGTRGGTRGRRPAFRQKGSYPTWAQPERYPVTVRYVEPSPKLPPAAAAKVRARLAGLGLSAWELERIDRRYAGDNRQVPLA
jgi:hypothetical protein